MKLLVAVFCFFSFGVLICSQPPVQINCALAVITNNPFGLTFFQNHGTVSSVEPASKVFEDLLLFAGMRDLAGEMKRILLLDVQGRNKCFVNAIDMSRPINEIFPEVEAGENLLFRFHIN